MSTESCKTTIVSCPFIFRCIDDSVFICSFVVVVVRLFDLCLSWCYCCVFLIRFSSVVIMSSVVSVSLVFVFLSCMSGHV